MVHQAAARRASPRLLYETRRATLVTEMKKSRLTKDLQDRIKAFYGVFLLLWTRAHPPADRFARCVA